MPSTCCLRYPQQLKAAQLGGCQLSPASPLASLLLSFYTLPLFCSFFSNSLFPSFFFCLSLLLLPLSPDMWRKTPLYRLGAKENCSDLGTKCSVGRYTSGHQQGWPSAAGFQALVSQPCLHYQALSGLNQGRTLQGRGNSSKHPICSVGKSYCISQGLHVRKPHEQSRLQLSPCRR